MTGLIAGPVFGQDASPVASVEVVSEGADLDRDIVGILGLEVGEPVNRRRVRQGIQILMAAGEFSWIGVRSDSAANGLQVTVEIDHHPRLVRMDVETPSVMWEFRVKRWLDLEVGDPVNPDRFESAARRIRRRIEKRGYPEVEVDPYLSLIRASNQAVATLEVRPGARARLAGIEILGLSEGVDPGLFKPKIKFGQKLTEANIDEIREKIERAMRLAGYWEAKAVNVERTGPAGLSMLKVHVEEGPMYHMEVEAPAGLKETAFKAIPDVAEEDLNPAQTDALAETIQERLRKLGYPLATVSAALETGETDDAALRILIDPGQMLRVKEVTFTGADQLDAKQLGKAVSVKKGSGKAGRPLTVKSLERDREILEDYYRRHGFQDVRVSEAVVMPIEGEALRVEFAVDEGLRWSVDAFRVEGAPSEALSRTDDDLFQLEVTDDWDPRNLEALIERWERVMGDVGYPEARVTAVVETPEAGRVAVVLLVQPRRYVRMGQVLIAGLTKTRRSVVERAIGIAGLVEGEPYSLATINRAQQELYRLGLFRRVSIAPVPGQELRVVRGVVVRLEEGLQRSYLAGFGWGTVDKFRITLGWSHLNLFGGAHALSLETRYSDREFRYQVGLREPFLPWINLPGYFAIYRTEEIYTDWDQLRHGVWFEVGDRLKAPFRQWVRYEYQVVEPNAPDDILSDLEREQQQIELSSISVPIEWDYRNDMLSPTSGYLITLAPEYAFPLFSAEVEFFKLRTGISHYTNTAVGRLNLGVRVGTTWVAHLNPDEPANLQIPLASRFFGGGPNSHRAFRTDRLGIVGETLEADGTAIGGNAEVLVNVEFVKPIWKALSGAVFVDGGNIWIEPGDINLGEFRWGVGAGVRFETPAGPFRLEYGHKLKHYEGESSGELYFSFGIAF